MSHADLSEIRFEACTFSNCNLGLATITKTAFRDVTFNGCKMLGLRFDLCNLFGLSFTFQNCVLNHSTFYRLKIKKTTFINSQILDADFTECDLTKAVFDNCDLSNTTFENTNLEQSDFRTSFNFRIDPTINRMKKSRFSLAGVVGLVEKFDIEIEGLNE